MRPGSSLGFNAALSVAVALAAAGAAVGLRWLLDPWLHDRVPLVTIFAAVAVSVFYGGYRPALLTAIVGYIACHYLFVDPRGSFDFSRGNNLIGFLAYLLSTSIIIGFGEALRNAQRVAQDRRELLRLTLASIGDAVIATDADGRIDFMNGIAADLTGWSPQEAAGQPLTSVFHIVNEATRQPVENPATKALSQGVIVGLANHTILIARDGTDRPIDDSAAPIRDANGRVVGCVLVFRDITKRRQTERALEHSERELRDFFENASVGLHWADPDGTILRANQTELDMLGYSREEYVGHNVAEFHADATAGSDILRRLAAGETLTNHPARLRCKDGTTKDVLISSNVLWKDGKFVHSRCFTRDISELKLAQGASALLAAIVDSSDDAIISKSLDGTILSWNRGAERLFGHTAAEAIGQSITLIIPPQRRDEETTIIERLRRGEKIDHFETVRVTKSGRLIDISVTISPLRDETGQIVGASKVARDITERRRAQETIRDSEQRLRLALDAGRMGTWEWHIPTNKVTWSTGLEALHGMAPGTFAGTFEAFQQDIHPDDREHVRAAIQATLQGSEHHVEYRIVWPDGSQHWVEGRGKLFHDEQGQPVRVIGVCADMTLRKQAEEALRESEQRFRTMADTAPAMLWITEPDGSCTFFSRGWYEFTGQSETQALGLGWLAAVHPDERDQAGRKFREAAERREPFTLEHRVRRADGQYRWVIDAGRPRLDGDGVFRGFIGSVIDVSDRKEFETSLRERESQLRVITDATPALISYVDADERYRFVNRQYERWFGHTGDEILGHTMTEVLGPEAVAVLRPHIDAVLQGQMVHFEAQAPYRDGGPRWIEAQYAPDTDPDGRVRGFFVLVLDVSERKRAEEREHLLLERALAATAKFEAVFQQSGIFAGTMDLQGYLREINDLAVTVCGYTREEVLNRPLWETPWWRNSADVQNRIRTATEQAAAGQVFREILPYWWADGSARVVQFALHPIRDPAGNVLFLHPTGIDITDQKQAEEALIDADRRKDEFLATLAHELRNPLAPIRNSLEIMKRSEGDAALVGEARGTMDRQLALMERLIDDLLDVSRITRNKLELRKQRVELASIVHHALEACRPIAEASRHEVAIDLPPEPIYLHGDAARLAQVFSNLLNNACKYTDPGGRIALAARRDGAHVVVTIRDNGIGIPREMLPRIFEIFTQVGRSLERAHGGLGIGLTLVRQLVEMHDGTVEAQSEGLGQGSQFVVRLPVETAAQQPAEPERTVSPPVAEQPSPRRRVLVVDDNKDGAESLGRLLRLAGHEIRLAFDGLGAIEAAEQFQPQLVLLDIGLPKINGYEACRRIREQPWGQRMAVVALTGWGQDGDRRKSKDAGFDSHLVKPVDVTTLLQLLDSLPVVSGPN